MNKIPLTSWKDIRDTVDVTEFSSDGYPEIMTVLQYFSNLVKELGPGHQVEIEKYKCRIVEVKYMEKENISNGIDEYFKSNIKQNGEKNVNTNRRQRK